MEQARSNPVFVAFIRHGERADLVHDPSVKYEVPSDPPLTKKGLQQAYETG